VVFFIFDEFKIDAVYDKNFTLSCRYEATRDLLVSPTDHQTNREISISTPFWEYILKLYFYFQKELNSANENPVEIIALNFGKWETANSLDSSFYALDCHAHAHISLTSRMFSVLEPKCQPLQGRYHDPNMRLKEDCFDLEQSRLTRSEIGLIKETLSHLTDDMKAVKESLNLIIDLMQQKK